LRTHAAERASQIGGFAALQENYDDQKKANNDVQSGNEVQHGSFEYNNGEEMAHFAKRIDYGLACLAEESCDSNPIRQFERWLEDAQAADFKEPNAMVLATIGAAGPSARVVLLKEVTDDGFVFYTNYESRKGQDLKTNPHCALTFYWGELERQVRVEGRAEPVSREKSEEYFKSRPRASQLGALASRQSTAIASRAELEDRVKELGAQYAENIPVPENWGGYCVRPERIEFWQGRANRLHDRIVFRRKSESEWRMERLSP
jgi:pyridoxamine 5'-phosphate oxidase